MPKRNSQSNGTVAEMTELIDAHLRHIAGGMSENTVRDRGELLHRVDDLLPMGLAAATTEELADFMATPGWSRETRRNYYQHLRGFFRWAADPDSPRLDYDPSAGLLRPRVPRGVPKPATTEEVEYALTHLRNPWRVYIAIAAYGGARCCEIANLRREDVTVRALRLTGKGDKVRIVPTHPALWDMVEPLPAGPVVRRIYHTHKPVTAAYVSASLMARLTEAGMHGMSAHRFRHWMATTALKPREFGGGGASLRAVQELLGHESITSTARYTLVDDRERAAAIGALPTFSPASW
jgi:integrase/recombinase XerC